jgi:signal transduction histidine kinase
MPPSFQRVCRLWRHLACLVVLLAAVHAAAEASPLETAAQVRGLTPEAARARPTVRLRGVVTYSEQTDFHAVFLQDDTAGIYIDAVRDEAIHQGQLLEVEGLAGEGGFAPIVVAHSWRVVGERALPDPKRPNSAEMQGGQMDGQWLEISGIVRAVSPDTHGRYSLELAADRDSLRVVLSGYPDADIPALVDSRIRVQGVCFTKRNSNRQWLANYLGVAGAEHLIREEAAPDPEFLPVQPIARLFRFPPVGMDGHRVKIQGVVLCAQPGGLTFVQDATQALQMETPENAGVLAGDQVEVIGFPVAGGFYPVMEQPRLRLLRHSAPPRPRPATMAGILSGEYGAELIELQARLVDGVQRPGESVFVLQEAGQFFSARLPGSHHPAPLPPVGSILRLSGVCLLPAFTNWEHAAPIRPASFELLLRDPGDLIVLDTPSWWTVRRVAAALAFVTAILVAVMVWVLMLRRRVAAQTKLIEHKIQREATIDERTRIARELHDTLAQGFVGIAFQLEAVATHLDAAAHEARGHLDLALTMVRHSLGEARRSVMNLRAQALETSDLAGALVETTHSLLADSHVRFELRTEGRPRRLPALLENNTLRIGQEAITNAIKYSLADHIQIHLRYTEESVTLRVEDFGHGFDPAALPENDASRFGLRGMRERAREMNAEFLLDSQPGRGTAITVTVPFESSPSTDPALSQ